MTQPQVTVWYDGACPLCVSEIALMRRLDAKKGRIAFVNLVGDGTCPLDRATLLARFHAQEVGKPIVSGAAAFGAMWRQITPFQPLGWLANIPLCLKVMDFFYARFLQVRPLLQKWFASKAQVS